MSTSEKHKAWKRLGWTWESKSMLGWRGISQRTLTMFVEVVALRYKQHITECHNSHKHSQSPLTRVVWSYVKKRRRLKRNLRIWSCHEEEREITPSEALWKLDMKILGLRMENARNRKSWRETITCGYPGKEMSRNTMNNSSAPHLQFRSSYERKVLHNFNSRFQSGWAMCNITKQRCSQLP